MAIDFNDPPDGLSKILLRWGFHFALGVFFSLPLAMGIFILVCVSPTVDLAKAAALTALFISAPCGLIAWLVGLIRKGEVLYWLISVLGIQIPYW